MAKSGYTYSVYVDDNFHFTDEEERYKLGDFATLDEAVAACKLLVDQFLKVEVPLDETAAERYEQYTGFGPDPFIVTNDPGAGHPTFSAWSYANERCQEVVDAAMALTRTEALPPVELWTTTSLLIVALLTFFLPLLTIQIPLMGTQYVSGYDIFSKTRQFENQLSSISGGSKKPSERQQSDQPTLSIPQNAEHPLPLSVRFAPLVPIEVTLAFVSCLVALLASRWAIVASKVAATVGAVSALSATIHVVIINADLHTWLQEPTPLSLNGGNPFAGFAQQLGKVLASSIQIVPGVGLYVLAVALVLVALAYHSRLLARLRLDK
jgi:hypothetical protein